MKQTSECEEEHYTGNVVFYLWMVLVLRYRGFDNVRRDVEEGRLN